jgi:hypothetical protein
MMLSVLPMIFLMLALPAVSHAMHNQAPARIMSHHGDMHEERGSDASLQANPRAQAREHCFANGCFDLDLANGISGKLRFPKPALGLSAVIARAFHSAPTQEIGVSEVLRSPPALTFYTKGVPQ